MNLNVTLHFLSVNIIRLEFLLRNTNKITAYIVGLWQCSQLLSYLKQHFSLLKTIFHYNTK